MILIASLWGKERVTPSAARVGIVCPVHFYTLPLLVHEFLERLDLSGTRYVFLVLTMGGIPGRAVDHAREALGRADCTLSAAFGVRMMGNYIAVYNVGDEKAVRAMQARLACEVARLAEVVAEGGSMVRFCGQDSSTRST